MIAYDEVIKIISDNEFIGWCCNFSNDFSFIKTDWGTYHLKLRDDDVHFFSTYIYDVFTRRPNIIILEALFYQARIGWNNRKKDILIDIDIYRVDILQISDIKEGRLVIGYNLYKNFESDKPISQEIQALVMTLYECYKTEIAKNKLDQISTKNIPDDFQEIINNNFDELIGE